MLMEDPQVNACAANNALLNGNRTIFQKLERDMLELFGAEITQGYLNKDLLQRLVHGALNKGGKSLNGLYELYAAGTQDAAEVFVEFCAAEALKLEDLVQRSKLFKLAARHTTRKFAFKVFTAQGVEAMYPDELVWARDRQVAPAWSDF